MISLLAGENSFELQRALDKLARDFDGTTEKIDGTELQLKQLPDLFMGATLFASHRLVVIKNLSENKPIWTSLSEWIPRIPEEIHVVLVEPKPDKRTKTYKELQKVASVQLFSAWEDRDASKAESWVFQEAKQLGLELAKPNAQLLVRRVGVDQWRLYAALEKLAVLDEVNQQVIENVIDASPNENVFYLLETALKGDRARLQTMIANLEATDDPYRLFGLLGGQIFQLATLVVSDKPSPEVAKDLGVHPYPVSQLAKYAGTIDRAGARKIVAAFADADAGMKTSSADPWMLIELALQHVAALRTK